MTRAILALVITCGTAALLRAEQWPNWRGPSSNGVSLETHLPVRWSKTENVTWRLALPALSAATAIIKAGPVFELLAENDVEEYTLSSPAISDGQIFIRTDKALYAVGKRIQRQ